ncbi:MFS transporter [Microcoleus sp. FACHB-672]|uniref:MFS transporter n=1 Tax=Microcoleus sp. FACHB-672 TaxID=2692825 RepID=UPI0016831A74|nr:MFS transporter [Microcoleus sp. FACHB-672]MBD2041493.1 MFS transporter [Microcoleus sp. FACHB-672]
MFESKEIMLGLAKWQFWLAQVPVDQTVDTPEEASLLFSGPQFFVALVSGVVLAFAFQLLFTNLTVAAGISYLGHQSDSDDSNNRDSDSLGGTINKIGKTLGIVTLVTVTIALFFACLLAVKLSLISSAGLGAIVGLVIWGTYFSLLVWVSSTTVGSLIGSIVNTATSGFQAIVGTAAAAFGAKATSNQIVSTAEAAASAVRREFGSAFDPTSLRETVEDYLGALKPPDLDIASMRQEFEKLLNDPQLRELASSSGGVPNIDRQKFVDLVSSRSDLSKRDVNRIVDQLENAWKQVAGQVQQQPTNGIADLVDYLKSANPAELISDKLAQRLDGLLGELRKGRQAENPSMANQALTLGLNSLMGVILGRTDLSDLDAQSILNKLKSAQEKVSDQAGKVATQVKEQTPLVPYSTVRADVENYLLNTYSWQMNPQTIQRDFRDVLYDPDADPATVRRELERLNRPYFVEILSNRGVFTQGKIQELANELEAVRVSIIHEVATSEEREKTELLVQRVEDYVRFTTKENLTAAGIERDFPAVLEDSDASVEQLSERFKRLDRKAYVQMLIKRQDLNREEAEQILLQLEATRDRSLTNAQELAQQANAQLVEVRQNLESYLRSTGKAELNPEGIKRDLQTLLENPQAGLWALRARLSHFDRDTLVQLLSQRQDLNEDEVNRVIDQVESNWNNVVYAPKALAGKAKEQYDQATNAIAEYLRSTGKSELNPEGIQRDINKLLNDPKAGATALRERLAQMDRDTLVKLLSQRQDLSEEQVNQVIDSVQNTVRNVLRAPRRVATRVQQQAQNFQGTLEDYLRNTGKEELNPDAIKRDLQLLLHDPKVGAYSLGERLSQFDRSTIVALLAQRPDISEAEANRIVDQIFSVREQFMLQIQKIQDSIQGVVDSILNRVRDYLNSLNRPELNYEGIRRDVRKLFYDPEAGFDALRDRLGHFNRDTLVAILSSREDISEADANRLIDQIEGARNNVLQRAEGIQMETQRRLDDVKRQAQRQAEETRKAAETASWWLFFTALISAAASAGAGALAVAG